MNDLDILTLKHQGYCCSQIMVIMTLDLMDRKNEDNLFENNPEILKIMYSGLEKKYHPAFFKNTINEDPMTYFNFDPVGRHCGYNFLSS